MDCIYERHDAKDRDSKGEKVWRVKWSEIGISPQLWSGGGWALPGKKSWMRRIVRLGEK